MVFKVLKTYTANILFLRMYPKTMTMNMNKNLATKTFITVLLLTQEIK